MRYDAVLFDLDGTLTQSERGILNCVNYALKSHDLPEVPPDMRRRYIGPPLMHSFMTFNGIDESLAEDCVKTFRERFSRIGWSENSVYTGIPHLLSALKRGGTYIALATAKPRLFAERILRYFGLDVYFDAISAATFENAHPSKAELVAAALPQGVDVRHAAMVGDTIYDMQGAADNGVASVGVSYGYGSAEELREGGATAVLDSVEALREYLASDVCAPGTFISCEGIDGCGKSTQVSMLHDWLAQCGHDVLLTREPGGEYVAEKIRDLILDKSNPMTPLCEAYLYAASRAQHVHEVIRPALDAGKLVLSDRFMDSSIAYQGYGRGLGAETVNSINALAVDGCMPRLTLLYDVDAAAAGARMGDRKLDRIESEKRDFHERVREGFRAIAADEPKRVVMLDANQSPDDLFAQTRLAAMTALGTPKAGLF